MEKATRVFLSYGHDEYAAFAKRLKRDLEECGFTVHWPRTAAPEPVPENPLSGVFGRLTPAGGPLYRRGRGSVRGTDPCGPRRGGRIMVAHRERGKE